MLKMCATPSNNTQACVIVSIISGNIWHQNTNSKDNYLPYYKYVKQTAAPETPYSFPE